MHVPVSKGISAEMDTGTSAVIVPIQDVAALGLATYTIPKSSVTYGSGDVLFTTTGADIGPFKAIVIEGQTDILFGPGQALDAAGVLTMDSSGGVLVNESRTSMIPIYRVGAQWRMWATDIAHYKFYTAVVKRRNYFFKK